MTVLEISIPRPNGNDPLLLCLQPGHSVVIVGANGSGKTRLGVRIEEQNGLDSVVRIPAHKSLALSDTVQLLSLERAKNAHRYGYADADVSQRAHWRRNNHWGGKPAVHLLSDYDALLQTLFAAHSRTAIGFLEDAKTKPPTSVPTTELDKLKTIWNDLLPHRELILREASIEVRPSQERSLPAYSGSEMSDGERAIFYYLGQCLVAPRDAIVIVDEPEAHVHKAILLPLWDAIENARVDCGFVYITHDSDFACAHSSAAQYFIRSYQHPDAWDIEVVPPDIGLPERIVTELAGSRKPILFVEGERGSIDTTIYRHQYPGFTVVPVGSCESVIHAVASYNSNIQLHRIRARGLVDADGRSPEDITHLETVGVHVLPVAEVENTLLLPNVFLALAQALACATPTERLTNLISRVVAEANRNIDEVCTRHAIRQIDSRLKRVGVNARDLTSLESRYKEELATVDPRSLFDNHKALLQRSIADSDLPKILALYDNKGLLAQAATCLGITGPKELMEKTRRLLGTELGATIREELNVVLPTIPRQ